MAVFQRGKTARRPDKSFTTTSVNYTYHFTATQHQTLASCLANNAVIALGLDSDCHFFNHGITCAMTLVPQRSPQAMEINER